MLLNVAFSELKMKKGKVVLTNRGSIVFNKINLKILNKDYLAVSKTMDKNTTFVVFDPPYISDDESVRLGRKTQIYGLKSFDHQRCANEFKKYSSGMYFNNLNTEFKNANLDMGNIEVWERAGKQVNRSGIKRDVSEIFVTRDLSKGIGTEFNKEGYSDARLALRAIIQALKSSKVGGKDEAVSQNLQEGVKPQVTDINSRNIQVLAKKAVNSNKKSQKPSKNSQISSKNNRKSQKSNKNNRILSNGKSPSIKSIRKFKLANATNNPKYTNNKSQKIA